MTTIAVRRLTPASFLLAPLFVLACSSSSSSPGGPAGGPVTGALDTHCGSGTTMTKAPIGECLTDNPPTNASTCGGVTFAADTGAGVDAGAPATIDYGATLYNATGFDDDCKYTLSWTATPIRVKTNVTFTVTVTRLADGLPAQCAGARVEVFLSDTHPVASPSATAPESPAGTYQVGPIKFDLPGMWTVRFHLYEECSDEPADSPHGHAAFYVDVPDPNQTDAGGAD